MILIVIILIVSAILFFLSPTSQTEKTTQEPQAKQEQKKSRRERWRWFPQKASRTSSTMNPLTDHLNSLKIKDKNYINIVLLGETGVGKSTFINSLANYLEFKKLKYAEAQELLVLIPSQITVVDKDYNRVTFKIGSDKNETQETGESATQNVQTYVFPIGESGKMQLRIIDTPGIGDVRGIEQDQKNCEQILTYLGQLEELHAICFLLKPNVSRITPSFEYCLKEILSRLNKTASKNLTFIFTNTRGSDYNGGETVPCLQKLFDHIHSKPPHVVVPLEKSNMFSVDNEAFRYLAAIKRGVIFNDDNRKKCLESWKNSSSECWRLIHYIIGDGSREPLAPHKMQHTTSINEARRLINELSKPLAEISELISQNLQALQRHQDHINQENLSIAELEKSLYIPVIKLQVKNLTQPVTVCTSGKCAVVIKEDGFNKWHYKQRCHDPCYLKDVTKEVINNPALLQCAAMSGGTTCIKCKCEYSTHMHIYYMTETVKDKIVDTVVDENISYRLRVVQESERIKLDIERRKKEHIQEKHTIVKNMASFAHFLQDNAISPINDSYRAYIECLIKREQNLGRDCDQQAIDNLTQLLRQYDEAKHAFEASLGSGAGLSGRVKKMKSELITEAVKKLFELKNYGPKIKELMDRQKASRDNEFNKNCEYVHPKSSAFGLTGSDSDAKKKSRNKDKDTKGDKNKKANSDNTNNPSHSTNRNNYRQRNNNNPDGRRNYQQGPNYNPRSPNTSGYPQPLFPSDNPPRYNPHFNPQDDQRRFNPNPHPHSQEYRTSYNPNYSGYPPNDQRRFNSNPYPPGPNSHSQYNENPRQENYAPAPNVRVQFEYLPREHEPSYYNQSGNPQGPPRRPSLGDLAYGPPPPYDAEFVHSRTFERGPPPPQHQQGYFDGQHGDHRVNYNDNRSGRGHNPGFRGNHGRGGNQQNYRPRQDFNKFKKPNKRGGKKVHSDTKSQASADDLSSDSSD